MAVPDRTGQTSKTNSEQDVLNSSFDVLYRVLAVMMLGTDGTNAVRLKTDSSGNLSVVSTSSQLQTLIDDVTTTSMTYIGTAAIGTLSSDALWTIKRLDESGTPTTLVVKWATAGASTCVWDDRASLTYS